MAARKQNSRHNNNRSRNGNKGNNNQSIHRSRNTYKQNLERYLNLAKDAASNEDQITVEGYLQHAEHYLRQLKELGPVPDQNQKISPSKQVPSSSKELSTPPQQTEAVEINLEEAKISE